MTALAPGAAVGTEGETPLLAPPVRQKNATGGKDLPEATDEDAEEQDKTEADPAFAWFATAPVLPQPAPSLPKLPVAVAAIQLPSGQPATPAAPTEIPTPAATPAATPADEALLATAPAADVPPSVPASIDAPALSSVRIVEPKPEPATAQDAQQPVRETSAPVRIELPPAQAAAGRTQPVTLAAIQPRAEAIQPLAEAIQPLAAPLAAAAIEAPAPRRQFSRETNIAALTPTATAVAPHTHAVPASADAQEQPALDLRHREGLTAMIERIEALRDTPGGRETSIRLSPDALGTVDVSIRHDGDRIHVQFSAETPAARAALAEAQPRLAELAESRGLRLGQTSVDSGSAGQGHSPRHDSAPRPTFTAPASALGRDTITDSDERVA